jgi:hypothetical protein
MKKNFDEKTGLYRFVKVNNVDIKKLTENDISKPVFLDNKAMSEMKHIEDNLYEYEGDYYIPSNY